MSNSGMELVYVAKADPKQNTRIYHTEEDCESLRRAEHSNQVRVAEIDGKKRECMYCANEAEQRKPETLAAKLARADPDDLGGNEA